MYWLKLVGTSEKPCPESYTRDSVDFPAKPRHFLPGDHMVLYAVGGSKRIFALAEVTSEVYDSGRESWPFRVGINYILNLCVSSGVPLDQVSTDERNLLRSIRRRSYIRLSAEEFQRAEIKLRQALSKK